MNRLAETLTPPATKGHVSVARLEHQWFIACRSDELGRQPIARTIQGIPMVLFRDGGGRAAALVDRCPHRNVPLSIGKVRGGQLECAYHGWKFDGQGKCRFVPGLCGEHEGAARDAQSHAVVEQDGYCWMYSTGGVTPTTRPYKFPVVDDPRYTVVRRELPMNCTMHAAIENALDVPHTGFLHGGLFRTSRKSNRIQVVIRRSEDRVEAEYLGEPAPRGLAGRVLAPTGGTVVHFDRFIMPCLAQVEYRLSESSHMVITSAFTPVGDFQTQMYAAVAFRLPIPGRVVRPLMLPVALRIFAQDAEILQLQTDVIRRFGGEQYAHTEIDVLGPHIWHLLRQAERGLKGDPSAPEIRREMLT